MPLIWISDITYERLKKLAKDGGDTPAKVREVIEQLVQVPSFEEYLKTRNQEPGGYEYYTAAELADEEYMRDRYEIFLEK